MICAFLISRSILGFLQHFRGLVSCLCNSQVPCGCLSHQHSFVRPTRHLANNMSVRTATMPVRTPTSQSVPPPWQFTPPSSQSVPPPCQFAPPTSDPYPQRVSPYRHQVSPHPHKSVRTTATMPVRTPNKPTRTATMPSGQQQVSPHPQQVSLAPQHVIPSEAEESKPVSIKYWHMVIGAISWPPASRVPVCGTIHDRLAKSDCHSNDRSIHFGLADSISATFLLRRQALICFSRASGGSYVRGLLVVGEPGYVVLAREAGHEFVSMFVQSPFEVVGYAHVKRSRRVGQDVHIVLTALCGGQRF